MIDIGLRLEYNKFYMGTYIAQLILFAALAATADARVYVTLPDPREVEDTSSCTRGCECTCERRCTYCCNRYKCSEVDTVLDDIEPSWPSQMDLPFQEEFSR